MRQIPTSHSVGTFRSDIEYTEAALAADPDAKVLLPSYQAALDEADGIERKERAYRREVNRAEALLAVNNVQLDNSTMRFSGYAAAEVAGNRNTVLFQKLFPAAPSRFVQWAVRKQCEHTLNVIVPELKKAPPALQPFGPELEGQAREALAALDARNKAKADAAIASAEVEEWKEGVGRLRQSTWAELHKIGASKGYSKNWAEGFFRSAASRSAAELEDLGTPPPASAV